MCQCAQYEPAYFGDGTKLTVLETNITTPPKVKVLRPSPKECKDKKDRKNKKTLVCVASGFYPDHVQVSWQISGVNVIEGVGTDDAALRDKAGKFYSITSRLRVLAKQWYEVNNEFTCVVSFFNGNTTEYFTDSVKGEEGEGSGMTKEYYKKSAQTIKLTYFIFIAKSSFYGLFIVVLVWKLQGSSGKQCN